MTRRRLLVGVVGNSSNLGVVLIVCLLESFAYDTADKRQRERDEEQNQGDRINGVVFDFEVGEVAFGHLRHMAGHGLNLATRVKCQLREAARCQGDDHGLANRSGDREQKGRDDSGQGCREDDFCGDVEFRSAQAIGGLAETPGHGSQRVFRQRGDGRQTEDADRDSCAQRLLLVKFDAQSGLQERCDHSECKKTVNHGWYSCQQFYSGLKYIAQFSGCILAKVDCCYQAQWQGHRHRNDRDPHRSTDQRPNPKVLFFAKRGVPFCSQQEIPHTGFWHAEELKGLAEQQHNDRNRDEQRKQRASRKTSNDQGLLDPSGRHRSKFSIRQQAWRGCGIADRCHEGCL